MPGRLFMILFVHRQVWVEKIQHMRVCWIFSTHKFPLVDTRIGCYTLTRIYLNLAYFVPYLEV